MALIKHYFIESVKYMVGLVLFLTLCNSCMGASKQKHLIVTQTHEGYTVKMNGKVVNQLFVVSEYRKGKSEYLLLRSVLNHGYAPYYTNQFVSINYQDFVLALNSVLKVVSATSDLNNLRSIEIDLISLGDECLRITRDYKEVFRVEKCIHAENVLSILWKSKLISDLLCMLSNYNLTINDIRIEMPFYTNWKDFSSYNNVNQIPKGLVSDRVLRGIIYIYCRSNKPISK
ncbi:MAG: hypothetical protein K6A82_01135 [Prevotella sp.]|nr:hypothetical protein [Prevotella sp.]